MSNNSQKLTIQTDVQNNKNHDQKNKNPSYSPTQYLVLTSPPPNKVRKNIIPSEDEQEQNIPVKNIQKTTDIDTTPLLPSLFISLSSIDFSYLWLSIQSILSNLLNIFSFFTPLDCNPNNENNTNSSDLLPSGNKTETDTTGTISVSQQNCTI